MEYNRDFRHDLKVGHKGERYLAAVLEGADADGEAVLGHGDADVAAFGARGELRGDVHLVAVVRPADAAAGAASLSRRRCCGGTGGVAGGGSAGAGAVGGGGDGLIDASVPS